MKLLTILLNWRTADMTLRALERALVELRTIPGARVCVVDNDSQDGSFEKISGAVKKNGWSDLVDVVQSGRNGGFGFGNNIALRRGLYSKDPPAYFYLLNPDAFVDDGAIHALLDHMDAHPRAGIAGSALHGLQGNEQPSCFRFPSIWDEIDRGFRLGVVSGALGDRTSRIGVPSSSCEVGWVAGASMMLRAAMLDEVGLFDETFFLYYEETDLCLRSQRAGWSTWFVKESSVAHIGGASTGVTSQAVVQKRMPEYVFASRRHYFLKNHGRRALWAANAAHFVSGGSFRLRRVLQRKADPERPREWLDAVLYNVRHP